MRSIIISLILILLVSCGTAGITGSSRFTYKGEIRAGAWLRNVKVPYEVNNGVHYGVMQIYFPEKYKQGEEARTLIVLHGYNHSMSSWERHSAIERFADRYNFVIVCPDMGKSLYELKYYPETTNKWAPMPGGKFVAVAVINHLRRTFALASSRNRTGIFGLSTGGRGAILLAANYNSLFGATGGLSGDYDPLDMKKDKLLTSIYGEYNKFPDRWKNDANIIKMAENLRNIPVFLSHGEKDNVVPERQSIMLAVRLKQLQRNSSGYQVIFKKRRSRTHDWRFWATSLQYIMKFFDENLEK